MGGRGGASSSERAMQQYKGMQARFASIADRTRGGLTPREQYYAATATAAENLIGKQRFLDLSSEPEVATLRNQVRKTGNVMRNSASVLGEVEGLRDTRYLNKPLGSRYTNAEWQQVKEDTANAYNALSAKGYTGAEMAVALTYKPKDLIMYVGGKPVLIG